MTVALYIPCYVDQLRPEVGAATVRLLERRGVDFTVLTEPACCGQPLINLGAAHQAACLVRQFEKAATAFEATVCPSGSCVASLRQSLAPLNPRLRVLELSEFLWSLPESPQTPGTFPRKVMVHPSCHGLRELGLGSPSERTCDKPWDTVSNLLARVQKLELLAPPSRDECCGFGGAFSVTESALSVRMAKDKLAAYEAAGAEVITATDVSCLMHLEGVAKAEGLSMQFLHLAEILAEAS